MPIHGEMRMLIANANLAVATGVPRERAIVIEDGDVVDLSKGIARVVGRIDAGYILVDGASVGDLSEEALADRKILGSEGFITIVAAINLHAKRLVSLDIHARGFVEDDNMFDDVRQQLIDELRRALNDGVEDQHQLQQLMRRMIGRWVSGTHRRRPMIVPVVVAT